MQVFIQDNHLNSLARDLITDQNITKLLVSKNHEQYAPALANTCSGLITALPSLSLDDADEIADTTRSRKIIFSDDLDFDVIARLVLEYDYEYVRITKENDNLIELKAYYIGDANKMRCRIAVGEWDDYNGEYARHIGRLSEVTVNCSYQGIITRVENEVGALDTYLESLSAAKWRLNVSNGGDIITEEHVFDISSEGETED